jgi:hypothetical protein
LANRRAIRGFGFARSFFLDDRAAVLATGARYLLLHRRRTSTTVHSRRRTVASLRLKGIYGEPVEIDERLAVFDLRRLDAPRKLQ